MRWVGAPGLVFSWCAVAFSVRAEPISSRPDQLVNREPDVVVRSETYLELYRRALLPGPQGALVESETVAPITEYVTATAQDLDAPWRDDSLSLELSVWAQLPIGEREQTVDGDVRTASVLYRDEAVFARLGRQHVAGGAARYARFDGLSFGGELEIGLGFEAYGGFSVLPRWESRYGYHHLGSAADTLLIDPEAVPEPNRPEHWLAGGRVYYRTPRVFTALSLHEQQQGSELGRRTLGADARAEPANWVSAGGRANLAIDAERLADAQLWVDATVWRDVQLTGEYIHAEPALYLSRQSVLSVFSTEAYDEVGGVVAASPLRRLRVAGAGFAQRFSGGDRGVRAEGRVRFQPDRAGRTTLQVVVARVLAIDNGYSSLRFSVRQQLLPPLSAVGEMYLYVYDHPILSYDTSSVYAANLEWRARRDLGLLFGGSLLRSPYAALDAQVLARLTYQWDSEPRGATR